MMTSGSFLSVARILAGVAVAAALASALAAALASLVFDVGGLPERLANALFFVCLMVIWLAACGVVVPIRATI
jgi:hypothetical protein